MMYMFGIDKLSIFYIFKATILKINLNRMKGGLKFHAHVCISAQSKYDCFSCFFHTSRVWGENPLI